MDHKEAITTKASERYLLDDMTPELRESFEEHLFDCPDCILDVRAGAAFIQTAKAELSNLLESPASLPKSAAPKQKSKRSFFSSWLQPAFTVPAIAGLLLVIGFQTLSTMRSHSVPGEPRILPTTAFHAGTRGDAHTIVHADPKQGVVLSIELPQTSAYATYSFTLYDPQQKQQWTRTMTAASSDEGAISLFIPGQSLENGTYTLGIAGVTDKGVRTEIERRVLAIQLDK
jgi:hypothetical protein